MKQLAGLTFYFSLWLQILLPRHTWQQQKYVSTRFSGIFSRVPCSWYLCYWKIAMPLFIMNAKLLTSNSFYFCRICSLLNEFVNLWDTICASEVLHIWKSLQGQRSHCMMWEERTRGQLIVKRKTSNKLEHRPIQSRTSQFSSAGLPFCMSIKWPGGGSKQWGQWPTSYICLAWFGLALYFPIIWSTALTSV